MGMHGDQWTWTWGSTMGSTWTTLYSVFRIADLHRLGTKETWPPVLRGRRRRHLRWQLNRRPLPCPQTSRSRRTWTWSCRTGLSTLYGFVDAVRVRLRCTGSSTSYGYEIASLPRHFSQTCPPHSRVRRRLTDAMAGGQSGTACKPTSKDQTWAGVAPSTMRICAWQLA